MNRWAATGVILASAVLAAAASRLTQDQARPTFRATADIVRVDVWVARDRRPVLGLRSPDFVVMDNGVKQDVTDVEFGKLPIDITIALDVSASVTGSTLDRLRRAIGALMHDLGAGDRLKLVLFDTRVSRVVDFTTDIAAVDRALGAVRPGGGTAMRDALSLSLLSSSASDRRQLVVCFTDAVDGQSTTEPLEILSIAGRSTATLTFVTPNQTVGQSLSATGSGRSALAAPPARRLSPSDTRALALIDALASSTGGVHVAATPGSDLTSTFRSVLDEFRSEYVLYFRPTGVTREGLHTLKVTIDKSGVVVRARDSYVGGS